MASLSSYFIQDFNNLIARKDCTLVSKNARITVLTERLVRLEYSKTGLFEDNATPLIINRHFPKPDFNITKKGNVLIITTKYFTLNYVINKSFKGNKIFPGNTLNIKLNNTNNMWYYGHPEVKNFGGSNVSLDELDKELKLEKGLFSMDGFVSLDDSSSKVLVNNEYISRQNQEIDIYVFMYKKDFGLCLKDYFALTGMPSMIPRYALGTWFSKNDLYETEDIQKLVQEFSDNHLPLSVLLLQDHWHDQDYYKFSNRISPDTIINTLKEKNIKLALSLDPGVPIDENNSQYEKLKEITNLNKKSFSLVPFNTKSLGIYFKLFLAQLNKYHIDFYLIDFNKLKDLYSLWLLEHYHFALSNTDEKRGLIASKNALIAPHRYPVLYSGKTKVSFDTLNKLPFYNLSASNIGVSWWAHAIGGYDKGIEDKELYLRYLQFGVFSPILSIISNGGKYHKREPWLYDKGLFEVMNYYLNLRYRLIPYIYSEGFVYAKYGSPLIQPLYYKYPKVYDDPFYHNEYFFGKELLVAPITKKKDLLMNRVIHKVFIPKGLWYDFKTGKKFPGDNYYVTFYKDEDYPVYCKAGGIIVLNGGSNNTNLPKKLEIHVFPGASNNYKLYEDDGESNLYKEGYYFLTSIDYNYRSNNYTLIIRPIEGKTQIVPEYRDYKIRFRNTKVADDVIVYVDDHKKDVKSYLDDNDFILEIEHVPTMSQLSINCKGKDIEIDATRLINEEIVDILVDLEIETKFKEKIEQIIFSDKSINKKRIAIRRLKKDGLDARTIKMFIRLLEYINKI